MTDQPAQQTSHRPRGEGQWALGYHEPLNTAEQIKKDDDGLNVRERIDRIFAPGGFRSIGKQDLRSRMRWWGLYTQRTQGVPGERTGSAEPEELEDEFFMMRIRIDGGLMTSEQLRAIAWASASATGATWPTSPTARTCSCTGSASRTSRRSSNGWRRRASARRRRAATRRG